MQMYKLRAANQARQNLWPGAGVIDVVFRSNELAGEVGEAFVVYSKAVRFEMALSDPTEVNPFVADLADELGDIVICADLVGMTAGVLPVLYSDRPRVALEDSLVVCNSTKKLHRLRNNIMGTREVEDEILLDIAHGLSDVVFATLGVANEWGICLSSAVKNKFNKTSQKHGLDVLIDW